MQTSAGSVEQVAHDLMEVIKPCMHNTQDEFFSVIAELELTIAQMRALFVLRGSDRPLALTELAPRMGLSVAAAGRAVDGLVRHGLVSRTEDPVDRRIKRLALTDEGELTLERATAARIAGLRQFAEQLGEERRVQLIEALRPVRALLNDKEVMR